MAVAQRGTSFTSQTADHYFVDRFKLGGLGTWTTSQSTDAPTGFSYSAKIECTTADASPATTDLLYFYTRFEGQDLQHLKFGTSSAEPITISFYVKCSKTGVFTVNWRNQDAGRSIGSDVTIVQQTHGSLKQLLLQEILVAQLHLTMIMGGLLT